MSQFKRVVNVIPLTRVKASGAQLFTYAVPTELQDQLRPGQLVKIPFSGRTIAGVVSSLEMHRLASETRGLKSLEQLLGQTPVVSEKNLALANWLADYLASPLGLVVKLMIPKLMARPKLPQRKGYERYNPDFVLTEHQHQAVTAITAALDRSQTFLLHGVTGSGKTEVYMQVIERILEHGKQVIILVPEISLTDQAIERFARRFGIEKIALWHSRLKDSQRFATWQAIRAGKMPIIIGPRSAIFVPVQELGLIVMDEEHDPSFKQFDQQPKYHARVVAEKLSELWRCPLILGDATPSVESFHRAKNQPRGSAPAYKLLTLPHRIKIDLGMPRVNIVDMRRELASGNTSIFSEVLKLAMLENLRWKKQLILFLNRRGSATFVMCRDCGTVATCQQCSANLVWHGSAKKLLCHHCSATYPLPAICPRCGSPRIKHFGVGTQRVEEELKNFLKKEMKNKPLPEIARMDSDTTAPAGAGAQIYRGWAAGQIQILIGTQLISKGWDISRVGLVGIISADTMLHLPDFRSEERTFQLLTQVAGRTGRGSELGNVVLQTYSPENYAIQAVKTHDYVSFYSKEIQVRREFAYPPFARLVKLQIRDKDAKAALDKAQSIARLLLGARDFHLEILGPAPAFIPRLRGRYQQQLVLKVGPGEANLGKLLRVLPAFVDIDVDPDSLL